MLSGLRRRVIRAVGSPPSWRGALIVVAAAFAVGITAGWLTTAVPTLLRAIAPDPDPTPTVAPSPSASNGPPPLFPVIERPFGADDITAGLTSLQVGLSGPRTYTTVPGASEPAGEGPTRWVRVEIEDGLPLEPQVVANYVMGLLNDPQGWGANGRMNFARTDGAAEIRLVFASPESLAALCPRPHEAAPTAAVDDAPDTTLPLSARATASPSPSASPSGSPGQDEPSCAEQGILGVNAYWWAAGLAGFPDDVPSARAHLLQHAMGHLLGVAEAPPCSRGVAGVMVSQDLPVDPCTPNPWPNPAPAQEE